MLLSSLISNIQKNLHATCAESGQKAGIQLRVNQKPSPDLGAFKETVTDNIFSRIDMIKPWIIQFAMPVSL
jgi:hypothetical protein